MPADLEQSQAMSPSPNVPAHVREGVVVLPIGLAELEILFGRNLLYLTHSKEAENS